MGVKLELTGEFKDPFTDDSKLFLESILQAMDSILAAIDTIERFVDSKVKCEALEYYLDRFRHYIMESIKTSMPNVKHIIISARIKGGKLVIKLPRDVIDMIPEGEELPVVIGKYSTGLITLATTIA